MIVKSLSRHTAGGIGSLVRYITREQKFTVRRYSSLLSFIEAKQHENKPVYVAGIKLKQEEVKYLLAENSEAKLQSELKNFKGTIKEFIALQMQKSNPEIVKEKDQLLITHNLRGNSIKEYISQFERNNESRFFSRVNQTTISHTILSWNNKDTKNVTDAMLKDMANEFIKLRGENNLYLITKHEDKDHIHLHVAISSAQLNGMSSRVSKEKYAEIKRSLDSIQRLRYPELSNSLPEHGKSKESKSYESKLEKIKFAERNEKATLLQLLETTYSKSTSTEHFLSQIAAHGFHPYYRNSRFQGIMGQHKFRLSTLGYKDKLQALEARQTKQNKVLAGLRELRTSRSREQVKDINEPQMLKEKGHTANIEQSDLQQLANLRNSKNEREQARGEEMDVGREISPDSYLDKNVTERDFDKIQKEQEQEPTAYEKNDNEHSDYQSKE